VYEPSRALALLLVVWAAIYVSNRLLSLEKYGLEVTFYYLIYRTKRFNEFLKKIAEKNKKFWQTFANLGIAAVVVQMPLAIYFLTINLQRFIYTPKEAEPITLILPGITIGLRWIPYILIAAGIAITVHEMAHGIISFSEKIPIKSSGIIIALVTFGGFVEPEEEVFEKANILSKLRVLAAGSLTNIITGLLVLLLLSVFFIPFSGVLVMNVSEEGPAYLAGMKSWDVIYSINGYSILDVEDFLGLMSTVGPAKSLTLETSRGIIEILTAADPENVSRGIIGVRDFVSYYSMRLGEVNSQFSYHLFVVLNWVSMIMINVAIFNMLPLFPFDGEACLYSLLKTKVKKGLKGIRIVINAFSLGLIIANIGFTFIRYGLTPF